MVVKTTSGERVVKTGCSNCYCGCGVLANVKGGKVVEIEGTLTTPGTRASFALRGRSGASFFTSQTG